MNRPALLAIIFTGLTATLAFADENSQARDMARKDYDRAMEKIAADDAEAVNRCPTGSGGAVKACLLQARGKRQRAEQEAKGRLERVGVEQPLSTAKANDASKNALNTAKRDERNTAGDIDAESKAANAECQKLSGAARKACSADVSRRRDEARAMADAMYKKSRSDAKALKAP